MRPLINKDEQTVSFNNGESWVRYIVAKGAAEMSDYRGKMCLINNEYLAKCISQDFISGKLTFEVESGGETFTRYGAHGVEVYYEENRELTFDDVKHKLRRI